MNTRCGSRMRKVDAEPLIAVPSATSQSIDSGEMDQILSTREVTRITGKHRCTIYRWVESGQFPKKKASAGREIGWRRSDVQRWLAEDAP
jgi:excisionase family DNA binding protein